MINAPFARECQSFLQRICGSIGRKTIDVSGGWSELCNGYDQPKLRTSDMASIRQIEANRRNAKRSTGPKTAGGKARSSRNALRHGLAGSCTPDDPELAGLMNAIRAGLACEIGAQRAEAVAHATCDLWRVRAVRQAMLADLLGGPTEAIGRRLRGLERYERNALALQKRALGSGSPQAGALHAIGFVLRK
jgi:hypothetical protein